MMKNVIETKCHDCGETIVFSKQEFSTHPIPTLCISCKRKRRVKREEQDAYRRQKHKAEQAKVADQKFEEELKNYSVIDVNDIVTEDDTTLLVLGNGFDLMHGVKSSYYNFRDSMGKTNELRTTLEDYLNANDIWWAFEHALSRIDVKRMANSAAVEASMDFFDGYDPYESASGFFASIDGVAGPMDTICRELPKRFRKWVNTLTWGTEDLPLRNMIRNPHVLCFNYTEFIESEYGVSHKRVCYIHGCRKNKGQALILGHMEGASDDVYDFEDIGATRGNNPLLELAQEYAIGRIVDCDESLTKHCSEIITKNKHFFDRLEDIENVIVVGHSLADVDREYFQEIVRRNKDRNYLKWFFGCYGIGDLRQIKSFIEEMDIRLENVSIFRTDSLNVRLRNTTDQPIIRKTKKKEKILCKSHDGQWVVKAVENKMTITNPDGAGSVTHMFSQSPGYAFFDESYHYLIVVLKSQLSGIYIYRNAAKTWKLIDELPSTGHPIINRRLRKVYLDQQHLLFVYNNRVMTYDLSTGELFRNEHIPEAKDMEYAGTEITGKFIIPV